MHRHVHKVVLHFGSDLGWWLGRQLGSSVLGSSGTSLFKYIFDKEFTSLKRNKTNKQTRRQSFDRWGVETVSPCNLI